MILSCKSILPLLYELHPDCPYLLPASFDPLPGGSYVRKPVHAREGANIQVVDRRAGRTRNRRPVRRRRRSCTRQLAPLKPYDGRYPVIGSWVVNGWACGIGIREDDSSSRGTPAGSSRTR